MIIKFRGFRQWKFCTVRFCEVETSLVAETEVKEGTRSHAMVRVPTRPGKPGKMRVHLENLEISWNFEKFNKYHGKMT